MERGDEIQMRFKDELHSRWDPTLAPPAYIWVGLVGRASESIDRR